MLSAASAQGAPMGWAEQLPATQTSPTQIRPAPQGTPEMLAPEEELPPDPAVPEEEVPPLVLVELPPEEEPPLPSGVLEARAPHEPCAQLTRRQMHKGQAPFIASRSTGQSSPHRSATVAQDGKRGIDPGQVRAPRPPPGMGHRADAAATASSAPRPSPSASASYFLLFLENIKVRGDGPDYLFEVPPPALSPSSAGVR